MKNQPRLVLILFAFLFVVAIWTLVGCDRPRPGAPDYDDPSLDTSPMEEAEEFEYLVDLEDMAGKMTEMSADIVESMEESGDMPPEFSRYEGGDPLEMLGLPGLVQESIMAEASDKMVHAHGEYRLEDDESEMLVGLAEIGAAEVELPGHFPRERWVGHLFIANVDDMIGLGVEASEEIMDEMYGEDSGMGDMGMMFGGMDDTEEFYNWMGDELVWFSLTNPDFDPEGEVTAENAPMFSVMACTVVDEEGLLDVIDFGRLMAGMMLDLIPEWTEVNGYEVLEIPFPDFESGLFYEMGMEMDDEMRAQLENIPSFGIALVPGYAFLADMPAIEAVLDVYEEEGESIGRMASLEIQSNLDLVIANFMPSNPGLYLDMIESPALHEMLMTIYNETRDLEELGTTRATVVVQDGENFELDVNTSKEAITLFEILEGIVNETDDETWAQLGQEIGELMESQDPFGSYDDADEWEYDPKPSKEDDEHGIF